ncbi:hypothetical protein [Nocardia sp. bgisy134]|uniref:hypothetical protein n=1 Tax=Nocardia sp. bgisy134 TaxID=3413789 RepID=UPI003D7613CC
MNDRTRTTVALVACSGIIGDLIRSCLQARADLTVVEAVPARDLEELSHQLRRIAPDVVVLQLDDRVLDRSPELIGAAGGLPVIAITDDGRGSTLWRLLPHRIPLGAQSIGTLVDTIHAVTAKPGETRPHQ